jgi:putative hydrolase of the HAD superfamily
MKMEGIRAVVFDAVGTLIHPDPGAAEAYAQIGSAFGSRRGVQEIRRDFGLAFARQEELDRANNWRTSEARERQRWRSIVGDVLHDVRDPEGCFAALYGHFSLPENWRCDPAVGKVLRQVANRGLQVGMASNFDHRLRQVLAGFPEMAAVSSVVISAEVGWRKPAAEFYAALAGTMGAAPQDILYLGDDLENDYQGAQHAGLRTILLAPRGEPPPGVDWMADLTGLLTLLV